MAFRILNNESKRVVTFMPGIWTHSTAVPVAFERNSAKVSSAMDKSLERYKPQIDKVKIHTTRGIARNDVILKRTQQQYPH